MSEFKVGEIAIYVRPGSPYYGTEVSIWDGLSFCGGGTDHVTGSKADFGYRYGIEFHDGKSIGCDPKWLKKKKPPARDIDKKVSWDDCIWKPSGVRA